MKHTHDLDSELPSATFSGAQGLSPTAYKQSWSVVRERSTVGEVLIRGQAGDASPRKPPLVGPAVREHLELLDGVRGVALLIVVAYHVASLTGGLAGGVAGDALIVAGNQAIIIFFGLSGFLLYRPFVLSRAQGRPFPSIKRYLRRRCARIVPAYWLTLTVLAVWPGVIGPFSFDDGWKFYAFGQLYSDQLFGRGIPPAWTLCVEVTFYLALPLWALGIRAFTMKGWSLARELGPLSMLALGGLAVQVAAGTQSIDMVFARALPGQLPWFALGMALATISCSSRLNNAAVTLERHLKARPTAITLIAGVAFVSLIFLQRPHGLLGLVVKLSEPVPVWETIAAALLTALVLLGSLLPALLGAHNGGIAARLYASSPLIFLGIISYGTYLWHLTIAQVLSVAADPAHFDARGFDLARQVPFPGITILVMTLALAGTLGHLSYKFVESPCSRVAGRASGGSRPTPRV